MRKNINQFIKKLALNPGGSLKLIQSFESRFQIVFPKDYKAFLCESNGAEGFVGQSYLSLWSLEEMDEINQMYINDDEKDEYEIGLIRFGSDGGGESYAFDTKQSPTLIINFPTIGIRPETIVTIGDTFYDFLKYLYSFRYR